jgi:hypothetical protein
MSASGHERTQHLENVVCYYREIEGGMHKMAKNKKKSKLAKKMKKLNKKMMKLQKKMKKPGEKNTKVDRSDVSLI